MNLGATHPLTAARPAGPAAPAATEFEPLLDVQGVRRALKQFAYTEEDVLADIEEGRYLWCWNIASTPESRRELRIFAPCVQDRIRQMADRRFTGTPYPLQQVLRSLFPRRPANQDWVSSSPDVCLAFVCSSELAISLVASGELKVLPGTGWRRGAGGAARITWDSLTAFLERRRIF